MKLRRQKGSVLWLCVVVALAFIFISSFMTSGLLTVIQRRQCADASVQSAALEAAKQLSRVVTSHPQWGYVALADQPAVGSGTMAQDGEPLPIEGINSITATVRLEKLLSEALASQSLSSTAEADYASLKSVSEKLQSQLQSAVEGKGKVIDRDGNEIAVRKAALALFKKNMPELANGGAKLIDFTVTLGWLDKGCSTTTLDQQTKDKSTDKAPEKFRSCINAPAAGSDFYFAALSEQPRLVDATAFRAPDGKRFCSVVLTKATIEYQAVSVLGQGVPQPYKLEVTAAAVPDAQRDYSTAGCLVVNLPQGSIPRVSNLSELLCAQELYRARALVQQSVGGDFPLEPRAKLEKAEQTPSSVSTFASRAFFDWLRTTHGRVNMDSLMKAMQRQFITQSSTNSGAAVVYVVNSNGDCIVREIKDGGFQTHTVSHGQKYQFSTQLMTSEKGELGLAIRDQVSNPDPWEGGRHAGQPLPNEIAVNYAQPELPGDLPAELAKSNVRKSYMQGGLAVCMEVFFTVAQPNSPRI